MQTFSRERHEFYHIHTHCIRMGKDAFELNDNTILMADDNTVTLYNGISNTLIGSISLDGVPQPTVDEDDAICTDIDILGGRFVRYGGLFDGLNCDVLRIDGTAWVIHIGEEDIIITPADDCLSGDFLELGIIERAK